MWQDLAAAHTGAAWKIACNWRRTWRAEIPDDDLRSHAYYGLCQQARWYEAHGGDAAGFVNCLNVGLRWLLLNEWRRERRWQNRRAELPPLSARPSLRAAAFDLCCRVRPLCRAVLVDYLATTLPVREIARVHGLSRGQVYGRLKTGIADLQEAQCQQRYRS